ncbi:ricin-type beta-trefoil lectin domain protein [Actinosynnema pretiosum subsp. pretiosum]|uniref:Ricin-type beta-trefoil lectin domain protein n=1 Tax=Actinosynnema pretiosum subsp. pretiosum TaxID=103721 RepID=A0AA45R3F3_9PSEU|nr:ricin-type beta-trefoil lectin domain protein [Actinosynnema pretiosum subsp. pretiosum]
MGVQVNPVEAGRARGARTAGVAAAATVVTLAGGLLLWPSAQPANAAVGAGTYTVTNGGSGLCLGSPGAAADAQLQLQACTGADGQKWALTSVSGGFRITSVSTGLCVGVAGAATSAGKAIQQQSCSGGAGQVWSLTESGSNHRVVNPNADKCMNTKDNATTAGAAVQTNSCDSAASKQWGFTPAGGGQPTTTTTSGGSTTTTTKPPVTTTTPPPSGSAIYASPSGTDGAAGTEAAPTTLTSAISRVASGGTIYLRGGTYRFSSTVSIPQGGNGTASKRTQLFAYSGETPVLNFSAQSEDPANRGLALNASYWHVRGIVVERAGDNGIFISGSNNVVERTVTRFNRDSGLQLSRELSSTPKDQWPANNLILSSESHDNADSDGEDADGFAAKLTSGPGNVFRYTVSHNNIDDGWDLYTKTDTGPIGAVTIEDSLAYGNGTLSDGSQAGNGDRNGFKLGGEDIAVNHVVQRTIAYDNGKHGFTYNRNLGKITMSNNVSVDSTERNFNFDGGTSVFRNNVSCYSSGGTKDKTIGDVDSSNQFWSGSNGSKCSAYSGKLTWSFASDGRLVVSFGGKVVNP